MIVDVLLDQGVLATRVLQDVGLGLMGDALGELVVRADVVEAIGSRPVLRCSESPRSQRIFVLAAKLSLCPEFKSGACLVPIWRCLALGKRRQTSK